VEIPKGSQETSFVSLLNTPSLASLSREGVAHRPLCRHGFGLKAQSPIVQKPGSVFKERAFPLSLFDRVFWLLFARYAG
jgi:hypothetical protein